MVCWLLNGWPSGVVWRGGVIKMVTAELAERVRAADYLVDFRSSIRLIEDGNASSLRGLGV